MDRFACYLSDNAPAPAGSCLGVLFNLQPCLDYVKGMYGEGGDDASGEACDGLD